MTTWYHVTNFAELIQTHDLKRTGMALAKQVKLPDVLDLNERLKSGVEKNRKKRTMRTMKLPKGVTLECEWVETFAATKTTDKKIRVVLDAKGSFLTIANWEPEKFEEGPENVEKEAQVSDYLYCCQKFPFLAHGGNEDFVEKVESELFKAYNSKIIRTTVAKNNTGQVTSYTYNCSVSSNNKRCNDPECDAPSFSIKWNVIDKPFHIGKFNRLRKFIEIHESEKRASKTSSPTPNRPRSLRIS